MTPETKTAVLGGAFGVGSSILNAVASGKMNGQQLAATVGRDKAQAILDFLKLQTDREATKDQQNRLGFQGAGELIGSPLAAAKDRQAMALRRAMLFGGPGGGTQVSRPTSPVMQKYTAAMPDFSAEKRFFTDDAMMASEQPFWNAISGMTRGEMGAPQYGKAGYQGDAAGFEAQGNAFAAAQRAKAQAGDEAFANNLSTEKAALMAALDSDAAKAGQQEQKKKGGFWKTLGKIGLGIGGGIATAMTGGAAAPLIGAAFGAGAGALDGGWKGAATGAGFGALGGVLGGAGSGVKQGFGAAAKSVLSSPQALAEAGALALPGVAGQAASAGTNVLPGKPGSGGGAGPQLQNQLGANAVPYSGMNYAGTPNSFQLPPGQLGVPVTGQPGAGAGFARPVAQAGPGKPAAGKPVQSALSMALGGANQPFMFTRPGTGQAPAAPANMQRVAQLKAQLVNPATPPAVKQQIQLQLRQMGAM